MQSRFRPISTRSFLVACIILLACVAYPAGATSASAISVGSDPVGIAVNPTAHRVYTAISNQSIVTVIDSDSNQVLTNISVGPYPEGIAVQADGTRFYVAHWGSNTISAIDATSNEVATTITVGNQPIGLALNSETGRLYSANSSSNTVSVVDTSTNSVIATIPVGKRPHFIAFSAATGLIYVTNDQASSVSVIDASTNEVVTTIPTGSTPTGIAVNSAGDHIFVANAFNSVWAIDALSHEVIAKIPVGSSVYGLDIDRASNRLYASNRYSNSVSVIDAAINAVVGTVQVGSNPWGVAVNVGTRRVYTADAGSRTVSVFTDDIPPPTAPSTPRDPQARPGGRAGEVTLTWQAPSSSGGLPFTYRMYRGTASDSETFYRDLGSATSFTDSGLPGATTFYYRVSARNAAGEGPQSPEVSAQTPAIPSDDCDGGARHLAGFIGTGFLKLASSQVGDQTWLCARANAGVESRGGKLVLEFPDPEHVATPRADENASACTQTPGSLTTLPPFDATVGDANDPAGQTHLTLSVFANATEGVWLCATAEQGSLSIARRLIAPLAGAHLTFLPDPPGAGPDLPPASPGAASSLCDAGQRVVNAAIEGAHLWISSWQETPSRVHLCARASGDQAGGGRLTVDTTGSPGVAPVIQTGSDADVCMRQVITLANPSISIRRTDPTNPASVCVNTGAGWTRFTAGTSGGPVTPSVTWVSD
jgi:YVTN family beta-propeller protein